ncbi:MAG: hypothetical protein IPL47_01695 [Phyllobacteriaceae bacterium]|nr:hypothetical protein [Phyllobacteriaceae bacterium]
MTTKAEVKRFLQPMLAACPELVLVGRTAVLPPVRHYLRCIYIRSGRRSEFCWPTGIVAPLYVPVAFLNDGINVRLARPGGGLWRVREPESAIQFAKIGSSFVEQVRAIDSPHAYLERQRTELTPHPIREKFLELPHRLFSGEFERVRELLQEPDWITFLQWRPALENIGLWDSLHKPGSSLSSDETKRLARWFHERERESLAAEEIGHLWEDTPMPLDTV